jgi:hypothetical protein
MQGLGNFGIGSKRLSTNGNEIKRKRLRTNGNEVKRLPTNEI